MGEKKMIIEMPNENSIVKWKNNDKDEWKSAEISDLIKAYERPQGEWILVSERLPEINVDVIVTDIETTGTYSAYYLGDGFWECDNGTHKNRIIAWMPFPEPYNKGGAE